jgi:hypothetical protein
MKKPAKQRTAPKTAAPKKAAPKTAAPKKAAPKKTAPADGEASTLIEKRIHDIGGWRSETMARMRALILEADPDLVEERKWIKPSNPHGVPTYSHGGLVLTLEVYKAAVKVTFASGAKVPDPTGIFNASLLGTRRAVDVHEGESVDGEAFKALVKAAVGVNLAKKTR